MASPNLMAAALARRTPNNSAICVLGNTLALYHAGDARRRGVRHARLPQRRAPHRRLPGRHARWTSTSATASRRRRRGRASARPSTSSCRRGRKPGPFTFNGRFNQLRYVNPWPQPLQKPHPPVWLAGGGSVDTWEMAAKQRLHLQLPQLLRLPVRQEADGRLLGDDRPHGDRPEPLPGRLRPADLRGRDRRAGRGAVHRARLVLLQQVPPHPAVLLRGARLPHPSQHGVRHQDEPAWRDRQGRGSGARTGRASSTTASSSPAARRRWPTA